MAQQLTQALDIHACLDAACCERVPQHMKISVPDIAPLQETAEIVAKRTRFHRLICSAGQNICLFRQSADCGFQITKQVRCERDHALRSIAFSAFAPVVPFSCRSESAARRVKCLSCRLKSRYRIPSAHRSRRSAFRRTRPKKNPGILLIWHVLNLLCHTLHFLI